MEYRFIKIQDITLPKLDYDYMLYCDSVELLLEHTKLYMDIHVKEGLEDYFQNNKNHSTTIWRNQIESLSKIKQMTVLDASTYLQNKVLLSKLKTIHNFGSILLSDRGTYMLLTEHYKIVDEVISHCMVYPYGDYSIRIIQWNGGKHYYAKVGKFDVVDKYGNQKWNSRFIANEKAEEFKCELLKELI